MKSQCLHHDKFRDLHKLIESQSTAHTAGYLELIWAHAAQAKHGPILKQERIEKIADWIGEPGVLLAAMLKVRFLDAFDGDCVIIHDWKDHCPEYVKRRDYMKDYMKDKREKEKLADVNTNLTLTGVKLTTVNPPTYTNLTNTNQTNEDNTCVSTSIKPKVVQKQVGNGGDCSSNFAAFWEAYPRRVAKGAAQTAWKKMGCDKISLQTFLDAIDRAKRSAQWKKDNGQFIPHPATWLNQRRWEDEPEPQKDAFGKEVDDDPDYDPFG